MMKRRDRNTATVEDQDAQNALDEEKAKLLQRLNELDEIKAKQEEMLKDLASYTANESLSELLMTMRRLTGDFLVAKEEIVLPWKANAAELAADPRYGDVENFMKWEKEKSKYFFSEALLESLRLPGSDSRIDFHNISVAKQALQCAMTALKFESSIGKSISETRFKDILRALLARKANYSNDEIVRTFAEEYLRYMDIRTILCKHLTAILSKDNVTEDTIRKGFHLLRYLTEAISSESAGTSLFVPAIKLDNTEKLVKLHRKFFGKLWMQITSLDVPKDVEYMILLIIDLAMPHMGNKEEIFGFLEDRFKREGIEGLLTANALFTLMMNHNLEFPDFYEQFYKHIDSNMMYSRHRSQFVNLADKFLTSTHIPAYVTAAYIKRMARMALFAPTPGIVLAIQLVIRLLKREPACETLINKKKRKFDLQDPKSAIHGEEDGVDRFDNDAGDFSATHALESSLWEGITLRKHYSPIVAKLASAFENPEVVYSKSTNLDFDNTLSAVSYRTIIETEMRRKRKPSVTYIPRQSITWEDDGFDSWDFHIPAVSKESSNKK